ncbi:MAG: hypothetical protein AAGG08_18100, partial [Actinomycetota bacterium]
MEGSIDLFGQPLGQAVIYSDSSDQLAPVFTIAAGIPGETGFLGLLVPGSVQAGITLDTTGLYAGPLLTLRSLFVELTSAAATNDEVAVLFGPLIDELAARLEADHRSDLARLLLDLDGDGAVSPTEDAAVIDADFLGARVLTILPPPPTQQQFANASDATLLMEAVYGDLAVAGRFATALMSDLLSGAADLDPTGLDLPADAEQVDVYVAAASLLFDLLLESPDLALVFFEVVDPVAILDALVQFEIFDVPIGEPAVQAQIVVNKEQIRAEFDGSLAKAATQVMAPCVPCSLIGAVVSDVVRDQSGFVFTAPFPVRDVLTADSPADVLGAVDPFTGPWSIEVSTALTVLGYETGTAEAIVLPGDSQTQFDSWFEGIGDGAPPEFEALLDDVVVPERLTEDGGVYALGTLQVPNLLADPLGWFATAGAALDELSTVDTAALPAWLARNAALADELLSSREAGRFEGFFPLPTVDELLAIEVDPYELDGDDLIGTALDLTDEAFLRGRLGLDLFGYRVAAGDFDLTSRGFEGDVRFPFFGEPLRVIVTGLADTFDERLAWPSIQIDEEVSVAGVRALLDAVGLAAVAPIPDGFDG